jgi:large subunit ribosomal protein L15
MKLHDLQPAPGSRKPRTRVGRGIAAGKGKTAGRGTKGQKARAGGSIPPWFEGGQTPLHMRIPKLRGFKNRFKIHYEVVNVGAIGALADRGAFEVEAPSGKSAKAGPITINQDILRAVGLVRTLDKPMKILGAGELTVPLFVVADAFTASARSKIEAAGGSVNVLEVPTSPMEALGVKAEPADATQTARAEAVQAEPAAAEPVAAAPDANEAAERAKPAKGKAARTETAAPDVADEAASTDAAASTDEAPAETAPAKSGRKEKRATAAVPEATEAAEANEPADADADTADAAEPSAATGDADDDAPAAEATSEPSTGDDA